MLRIIISGDETYNNETGEFGQATEDIVLEFEHSLVSLSKWESKHKVPFLTAEVKSTASVLDYLRMMIITPGVDPDILSRCTQAQLNEIQEYIQSTESATTFGTMPGGRGSREVITSELIYYWLVAFTIPFEVETWHLNRLFSLIRICNVKNQPAKKVPRHELAQRYRDLNAQRKAALGTTG